MTVKGIKEKVGSKVPKTYYCRCGSPGSCNFCDFYAHRRVVLDALNEFELHQGKLIELNEDLSSIDEAITTIEIMDCPCATTYFTQILETLIPLNSALNTRTDLY